MVALPVTVGPARYGVQVAMSLDDAYAVLRVGRWLVLSISVVMLTGIGLTGGLLARKALGPIDAKVSESLIEFILHRIGRYNFNVSVYHRRRIRAGPDAVPRVRLEKLPQKFP